MPKTVTWERVEEPRVLRIVLSEATEPEIKQRLSDWIHSAGKSGRVTKVTAAGDDCKAWGLCTCLQGCKYRWRWDLHAQGEGEGADCIWFGHGEHPAQDEAAVRKQKREEVAQAVAHMPPLQAHAHLLHQPALSVDDRPSKKAAFFFFCLAFFWYGRYLLD